MANFRPNKPIKNTNITKDSRLRKALNIMYSQVIFLIYLN